MKNSLGLGGDGDEVDFVRDVEAAFGIRFEKHELETCVTFGDLYDRLCAHVQLSDSGKTPCLTAAAFWRIRGRIAVDYPGRRLTPDTRLCDLRGNHSVSTWWTWLGKKTELRLPQLEIHGSYLVATIASIVLGFPIYYATGETGWRWPLLGLPAVWFVASKYWPKRLPISTLGDLARVAGASNAGLLSAAHGELRARDAWWALEFLARECAHPGRVIDRDTKLVG